MKNGYELLIEKEEMWARVLTEVLRDHDIPFTAHPVYGAGFVIRTGTHERLRVFVPEEHLAQAAALAEELFSADPVE